MKTKLLRKMRKRFSIYRDKNNKWICLDNQKQRIIDLDRMHPHWRDYVMHAMRVILGHRKYILWSYDHGYRSRRAKELQAYHAAVIAKQAMSQISLPSK